MPSSREQIWVTAAALPASSVNPGLTAPARVTNRLPASDAATAPDRAVFRQSQRRYREDEFAGHVQAFPAGGQDAHPGAVPGQHGHHPGGRRQDVLAVVEHDQQLAVRQRPHDARHRVRGVSFRDPQRLGDGGGNERGIGERGQFDQPGAVTEPAGSQRRRPQGEPCLTAPARAGQRYHAGRAQAVQDRGDLRPAAHQRAHLGGQPAVPLELAFGLHTPGAHQFSYYLAAHLI